MVKLRFLISNKISSKIKPCFLKAFWCQSYQRQQAQFILKVEWRSSSWFVAEATSCSPTCFFPYSFRAEHLVWAQDMSMQRLSASWELASYDHVVQYMGCRGSETDNCRLPSMPWKEGVPSTSPARHHQGFRLMLGGPDSQWRPELNAQSWGRTEGAVSLLDGSFHVGGK